MVLVVSWATGVAMNSRLATTFKKMLGIIAVLGFGLVDISVETSVIVHAKGIRAVTIAQDLPLLGHALARELLPGSQVPVLLPISQLLSLLLGLQCSLLRGPLQ